MSKKDTSRFEQQTQVCQLLLLEPGSEGWKNPQPNQDPIRQLRSPHVKALTTQQLQDRLNIPQRDIRKCEMGVVLAWDYYNYLIWHQGRDRWAVYERSTM